MIERVGSDQSAANEDLSPSMRLAMLRSQERSLDREIIELEAQSSQNQLFVQRLKHERLHLKELIKRLEDEMIPDLNA